MTHPFYLTPSITASDENLVKSAAYRFDNFPDSKVQVAHMGPTWVLSAPGGPHVGPMNLAIRVLMQSVTKWLILSYLILSHRHKYAWTRYRNQWPWPPQPNAGSCLRFSASSYKRRWMVSTSRTNPTSSRCCYSRARSRRREPTQIWLSRLLSWIGDYCP